MRFLIALILMSGGFVVVWKSEWIYYNFGSIPFFDKYLGTSGGGRLGYKLFGVLFIFMGIMYLTGLHTSIFEGIARLLIPGA